jgi:hypothetical protein
VFIKVFKIFISVLAALVAIVILTVNINIHYDPELQVIEGSPMNHSLLTELRGLKHSIANDTDIEMQQLYPEGYIFLNAIYALAWCNAIEGLAENSTIYEEGIEEVIKSFQKINSDRGRGHFYPSLPIPYGSFYAGWNNYVLARKLQITRPGDYDTSEVKSFKHQSAKIASVLNHQVYPPSYYGSAWPADVMTGIASLSIHDKLFAPKYQEIISNWLHDVKMNLDSLGLIPHEVNPIDARNTKNARGSSQSLTLILLKEIDPVFGEQQFQIYCQKFVDEKFGLLGIREYPSGINGNEDVDSGPVVSGIGAVATIVGMQTLSIYGNGERSVTIRNELEGFGIPYASDGNKRYLLGLLPMADAFIAWGHSSMPVQYATTPSFIKFHLICAAIILLITAGIFFLWIDWKFWERFNPLAYRRSQQ